MLPLFYRNITKCFIKGLFISSFYKRIELSENIYKKSNKDYKKYKGYHPYSLFPNNKTNLRRIRQVYLKWYCLRCIFYAVFSNILQKDLIFKLLKSTLGQEYILTLQLSTKSPNQTSGNFISYWWNNETSDGILISAVEIL